MLTALLSTIAAILQSAGALVGPGFIISALATMPIALASMLALRSGVIAYVSTLFLLLIIQPSELIIFPFTTGFLGLGIGIAFTIFSRRGAVIAFAAFSLTMGIAALLYCFGFPVLGSLISGSFRISVLAAIYAFSLPI